ncbi:MAG: hypothetical protein KGZ39_02590 [Simkania sp.]|nr:hypothetical protein [Simkania sp.]
MPSASPDHRSSVSSITPSVSITPPVSITTPHGSFAQRPLPPTPPPRRDSEISIQEIPEEDSGGDSEEIYVNPNAFFKAPAGSPAWQEEKSRRRTSLGFQSSFELYKATQAQIKRAAGFTSLSGAPIRYAWNASHSSEDYVDLSSVKREITLATTHEEDVQQMEFSEDAIMHSKGEDA